MVTSRTPDAPAPRRAHLERHAASELLAQELRREILDGTLRPGESLREMDLTERYSVARNTVREALRLLTRDGLGTHEVHRGVTVRVFSVDEVREIFDLRQILEEIAARRAGTLSAVEIERLESALQQSEDAFQSGDDRAGLTANLTFHRELVGLVGNSRMDAVFGQLLTEIRLVLAAMEERSGGHWVERNRALLQALVEGDAEGYRQSLNDYMHVALREATQSMEHDL